MLKFKEISKPISFTDSETVSLKAIHKRAMNADADFQFNFDPDYQRDRVWTDEQAENFMGHVLEGGAVPIIILNHDPSYEKDDEVVDGKQRMTAVARWVSGEIAARLSDGRRVFLSDFDESDQRYILSYSGPTMTIKYVQLDRAKVLDLYIKLNRGGTVHTKEEIDRVRALRAELD